MTYDTLLLPDALTNIGQLSQNQQTEATPHTPRIVRVCIPSPIHAEIAASPLRDREKLIVYSVVYACATERSRCKSLSTKMLDHMVGQRGRRRVINYLLGSEHFGYLRHEIDVMCRAYYVAGVNLSDRSLNGTSIPSDSHAAGAQHTGEVLCVVW